MAGTIRISLAGTVTNGSFNDQIRGENFSISQTNQGALVKIVSVTTSEADLDLTGISVPGWLYIKNLDATNYIQLGPKSGGAMIPCLKLKAGEGIMIRFDASVTLRWKANTATCLVHVRAYED